MGFGVNRIKALKMLSYLLECFHDTTYREKMDLTQKKLFINALGVILSKEKCIVRNRNFIFIEQILHEIQCICKN